MSVSWMSTELRSDLTNHKSKQQSFRTLRNWGYQYLIIVPLSKRNSYSLLMVSYVLSPFNSRFLFHVILRKLINMVVEMQYIAVTRRRKHMWTIQGFMDAWLSQMLTTVMTVFYHVCVETCVCDICIQLCLCTFPTPWSRCWQVMEPPSPSRNAQRAQRASFNHSFNANVPHPHCHPDTQNHTAWNHYGMFCYCSLLPQ